MVERVRRELGKELITFIDGTKQEISIHAVGNYEMMKLRRQFRKTILKKGEVDSVDFEDENFILAILDLATGTQISKNDLMEVDNDLKKIYDKYFTKELDSSKKPKSTDISTPEQDNELKE
jgi:hypothetical protein